MFPGGRLFASAFSIGLMPVKNWDVTASARECDAQGELVALETNQREFNLQDANKRKGWL